MVEESSSNITVDINAVSIIPSTVVVSGSVDGTSPIITTVIISPSNVSGSKCGSGGKAHVDKTAQPNRAKLK